MQRSGWCLYPLLTLKEFVELLNTGAALHQAVHLLFVEVIMDELDAETRAARARLRNKFKVSCFPLSFQPPAVTSNPFFPNNHGEE